MESNPWTTVEPVRPHEAEVQLGFLFLDAAQDEQPDPLLYGQRLTDIINGLYYAGWQDCKEELRRRLLEAKNG